MIKSSAALIIGFCIEISACLSDPLPPTIKILEHMSQSQKLPDNFRQRQKKLDALKELLDRYKMNTSIPTSSVPPPLQCEKIDTKISMLKKLYKKQYSMLDNKDVVKKIGQNQQNTKYHSIMEQMKQLMSQMDQRDIPLMTKYQSAVHCHELFAALEKMVNHNDDLVITNHENLKNISNKQGRGQAVETTVLSMGEIDHAPRNNERYHQREQQFSEEHIIIVPASIAVKHGIDKLAEDER